MNNVNNKEDLRSSINSVIQAAALSGDKDRYLDTIESLVLNCNNYVEETVKKTVKEMAGNPVEYDSEPSIIEIVKCLDVLRNIGFTTDLDPETFAFKLVESYFTSRR